MLSQGQNVLHGQNGEISVSECIKESIISMSSKMWPSQNFFLCNGTRM